jgi:hypothetical protein
MVVVVAEPAVTEVEEAAEAVVALEAAVDMGHHLAALMVAVAADLALMAVAGPLTAEAAVLEVEEAVVVELEVCFKLNLSTYSIIDESLQFLYKLGDAALMMPAQSFVRSIGVACNLLRSTRTCTTSMRQSRVVTRPRFTSG